MDSYQQFVDEFILDHSKDDETICTITEEQVPLSSSGKDDVSFQELEQEYHQGLDLLDASYEQEDLMLSIDQIPSKQDELEHHKVIGDYDHQLNPLRDIELDKFIDPVTLPSFSQQESFDFHSQLDFTNHQDMVHENIHSMDSLFLSNNHQDQGQDALHEQMQQLHLSNVYHDDFLLDSFEAGRIDGMDQNQRVSNQIVDYQKVFSENQQLQQKVQQLMLEKKDFELEFQQKLYSMESQKNLEIENLKRDVLQAREMTLNLEKERDIQVLHVKKELLLQQEQLLKSLQNEMKGNETKQKEEIKHWMDLLSPVVDFESKTITDALSLLVNEYLHLEKLQREHKSTIEKVTLDHSQELKVLNEAYKIEIQKLESDHETAILDLKTVLAKLKTQQEMDKVEYQQSLGDLKDSYQLEYSKLKSFMKDSFTDSKRVLLVDSIQDLLDQYPVLMNDYKNKVIDSVHNVKKDGQQDQSSLFKKINELEKENESLRNQLQQLSIQCDETILYLKKECSKAYESSLLKLIQEYKSMESQNLTRFRSNITFLEQRNKNLEQKIMVLEQKLEKYENEARPINELKQKYVDTLKQMKQELLVSKNELWKAMETEWNDRKLLLNQEWQQKLNEVKISYRNNHEKHSIIPL